MRLVFMIKIQKSIWVFCFLSIFFAGCISESKISPPPIQTYLCPDGSIVNNISNCPQISVNTSSSLSNTTNETKQYLCPSGHAVSNESECPCPLQCDDYNECTREICDWSTNFTCVHLSLSNTSCGYNQTCVNGSCQNTTLEKEVKFLYNESQKFIDIVNKERLLVYAGKSKLESDKRLEIIAEACAKEILLQNSSDLTVCFEKWGSFKELLTDVGFYGRRFYFFAEANQTSDNITYALYKNLTRKELQLLINKSTSHPGLSYPFIFDYIGASIGCLDNRCVLVAITAANRFVSRINYDNWWVYDKAFLSFADGRYVPRKYKLTILDASDFNPAWCKIFIYNLSNSTLREVSSYFWWSDSWEYANHGYNYERRVDWTDYSSEVLPHPSVLYFWCYSTKKLNKEEFADKCKASTRDRIEFSIDFLEKHDNYTEEHVQRVLQFRESQRRNRTIEKFDSLLDYINSKRLENNLSKLNYSQSLSVLATSCMREYLRNFDMDECWDKVFFNTTFSAALGARGMFGEWVSFYNLINDIQNPEYLMDTVLLSGSDQEYYFGDSSKNAEYFGYGKVCEEDICASMLIWGSNRISEVFKNVRKDCGWADIDCSYGYTLLRNFKKGCGNKIDPSFLPNITIKFNSSVPAVFYFYKNKDTASELWENGWPRGGYEIFEDTYRKEYNITLPGAIWSFTYWPKIKSVDDKERLSMEIIFTPKVKVE